MEAEKRRKEDSEAECTTAKDDLTKAMTHAKDTIGQLKQMCARLETSLQTKQDALHDAQKEVDTLQKQKDDLLDRLTTVRTQPFCSRIACMPLVLISVRS